MGRHLPWKQAVMKKLVFVIATCFFCSLFFAEGKKKSENKTAEKEELSFTEEEIINADEDTLLLEQAVETAESAEKSEGAAPAENSENAAPEGAVTGPENKTADSEDSENSNTTKIAKTQISFISEEDLSKPEVEKFRKLYLSEKWSTLLRSYLENAMEYRLYVRKAVQDKQMPEMLEYLPVVESNYKTNAKSRSGAIGMWQFMANSVWPFLTLNDFVDERLDPWKSTDAALRKLTDNYNVFNDWLLAIGAYNCGVGAMNKAIRKAGGKKDFWYLAENGYLSRQTAEYVPKLIAITDLAINSEYYGIDIPNHKEEFEILENEKNANFDYITVKKAYSLNQLAQEMRMNADTLKKLNPSYTMGMTHPSRESQIRLPLGMQQSALDAIANLKPVEFPIKYTVVAGDSLWSISRKYKTTVQAICELNGIKENAILKIGKILYIPSK